MNCSKKKRHDSGKLFDEFCKRVDDTVTDRSYEITWQRMIEFGLVKEISSGRWKKYEII